MSGRGTPLAQACRVRWSGREMNGIRISTGNTAPDGEANLNRGPRLPADWVEAPAPAHDIAFLDGLLDETLRQLEGEPSFQRVQEVRAATQRLRALPSVTAAHELLDQLSRLELSELRMLTRAFTHYFDLINLAEQR